MNSYETLIQNRVQEHYNEAVSLGFEVVGVWLQGSQNYNLAVYDDTYQSDVDTKCIVLPSFDDIVCGKSPYSSTHIRANEEHIDIKDIRVMFDMFKKQNNSYVELLFTKYFVINPKYTRLVAELIKMREAIAYAHPNQALRCMAGTSKEKLKALKHPYPNIVEKINKYGYDPKQLHHILRINDLIRKYTAKLPYAECLIPDNTEYLLEVKKGKLSLKEAEELANDTDWKNAQLKEWFCQKEEVIDYETFEKLDALKVDFIRQFLMEELRG